LVRKKLGLKKWEGFRFANQRADYDFYVFTPVEILKVEGPNWEESIVKPSRVSLNWLLNKNCEIVKLEEDGGKQVRKCRRRK
jgi:hypothetical protein